MADTPEQTVRGFLAGFGKSQEDDLKNYEFWMTPDVKLHTGVRMLSSRDEVLHHMRHGTAAFGVACFKVHIRNLLCVGDLIAAERVDTIYGMDGSVMEETPVMGIFKVVGGKIAEWRDYFDSAPMRKLLAERGLLDKFKA